MARNIYITGLIETVPIASEENTTDKIYVEIDDERIIKWDNESLFIKDLTKDKGAYVIYDYEDSPVYVGKTWDKDGFLGRFKGHRKDKKGYFPYWELIAKNIRFYIMNNQDPIQILLLERIKIHHLNPPFNKDEGIDSTPQTRREIREKLFGTLEVVKDFYRKRGVSDEYINYIIVKSGFNEVNEALKKELEDEGYFSEWFEIQANKFPELSTQSKPYINGFKELINY